MMDLPLTLIVVLSSLVDSLSEESGVHSLNDVIGRRSTFGSFV